MIDISDSKKALREVMRQKRAQIVDKIQKGQTAQINIIHSDVWQKTFSIAVYSAMKDEVQTNLLMDSAWRENKKLLLPKITDRKQRHMIFLNCSSCHDLIKGAYGIMEPLGNEAEAIKPDLLIVPGLAFTPRGERLGYGGGFYDRFFALNNDCLKIGICLHEQIIENVPQTDQDIKMNAICSDKGLVWI